MNVAFDILHIVRNSPITLLRSGKILEKDHDPSHRRRGICLFKSGPRNSRCGGREKLH